KNSENPSSNRVKDNLPQSEPVAKPASATSPAEGSPASPSSGKEDKSHLLEIKSPMIGTFYRSANPDTDYFVNVGDTVQSGQPVCIIEAMKLFNEVESEISGKIVEILVENASPVEYDQPLFLVEPIK
ncbi:MAG: acetyl-CoA carboxylase biotin carboxyl carrier protein, partial [Cyclobacteriaceae bacterium]